MDGWFWTKCGGNDSAWRYCEDCHVSFSKYEWSFELVLFPVNLLIYMSVSLDILSHYT